MNVELSELAIRKMYAMPARFNIELNADYADCLSLYPSLCHCVRMWLLWFCCCHYCCCCGRRRCYYTVTDVCISIHQSKHNWQCTDMRRLSFDLIVVKRCVRVCVSVSRTPCCFSRFLISILFEYITTYFVSYESVSFFSNAWNLNINHLQTTYLE